MTLHERIIQYVEKKFQASGRTEFPTVREVARALRVRQSEVEIESQEDGLMLTYYNVDWKVPIGDYYVETL